MTPPPSQPSSAPSTSTSTSTSTTPSINTPGLERPTPADIAKDVAASPLPNKQLAPDALPVEQFLWGGGIECSFLPHLNVDQFEWTQHNRFWKEDLKRIRDELG